MMFLEILMLFEYKMDVDAKTWNGCTALHQAAGKGIRWW